MHVVHDIHSWEPYWESAVLTLGVFDGMHKGHQALVKRLQKRSRKGNRARVIVTYNPHPDLVLGKKHGTKATELFTYTEKLALFQSYDLDAVIFLPFTLELARMTAMRYLKEILLGRIRASHIIIGYDQCFGRGRKGDFAFLKKMSRRYDFTVERVRAVKSRSTVVSTSAIRSMIQQGEIEYANRFLGHPFFMTGTVIRGFQRGRKIGFPTANLDLPETKTLPGRGVYAGRVERGGRSYKAMINVGVNPTFGNEAVSVEAHILDFDETIYGEQIRLYLMERLRDEMRFSSIEDLVRQLERDKEMTKKLKLKI